MQEEVKCSRRTRNYLKQAGLIVSQKNCVLFNRGDTCVGVLSLLLYSAMTDFPRVSLKIRVIEVLSFVIALCLLWTATKQKWPAMALNFRINFILFAVFIPIILAVVFISERARHPH